MRRMEMGVVGGEKERRKVVGFLADEGLWKRFKVLAASRGLGVGEILVSFIEKYLEEGSPKRVEEAARRRAPPMPEKGVERTGKRKREEIPLEQEDRFRGPRPGLAEYASLLGVEDGGEGSLRERVLDAIEKAHGERSGEDGWLEGNLAMVQWYNDNRG